MGPAKAEGLAAIPNQYLILVRRLGASAVHRLAPVKFPLFLQLPGYCPTDLFLMLPEEQLRLAEATGIRSAFGHSDALVTFSKYNCSVGATSFPPLVLA